jgi:hypothetical protein
MKPGDQCVYTWGNHAKSSTYNGKDYKRPGHTAPCTILKLVRGTHAVVEFAKGGQRVEQTVPLAKLTLRENQE